METTLKLNLLFLDFFPVLFCVRGNNIFLILTKPFFFFFFLKKKIKKKFQNSLLIYKSQWIENMWISIKLTLYLRHNYVLKVFLPMNSFREFIYYNICVFNQNLVYLLLIFSKFLFFSGSGKINALVFVSPNKNCAHKLWKHLSLLGFFFFS